MVNARTWMVIGAGVAVIAVALFFRMASADSQTPGEKGAPTWAAKDDHAPKLMGREQAKVSLKDTSPVIRERAAMAYADAITADKSAWLVHEKKDVEPLIETMLHDEHVHVRAMAATALGRVRSKYSLKPLGDALDDGDPRVRDRAHESIQAILGVRLNFKGNGPEDARKRAVALYREIVKESEKMEDRVLNRGRAGALPINK